jgi:hypothetical protein
MRRRWNPGRGAVAIRVLGALIAVSGCLVAVAYAAKLPHLGGKAVAPTSHPAAVSAGKQRPKMNTRPPRPRIGHHPEAVSTTTTAKFTFTAAGRGLRFQCRLDRGRWRSCRSTITYAGLGAGNHSFSVRTQARRGGRSAASVFRWVLVEPKPFSIEPQLGDLADLFPGAGAIALPVRLSNPNSVPIVVTSVRVGVSADPPGCESAANVELTPSSAASSAPLTLPAGGSVTLPAAGISAPAIALRDLPVNQDACQGAEFPLVFSGEAHG